MLQYLVDPKKYTYETTQIENEHEIREQLIFRKRHASKNLFCVKYSNINVLANGFGGKKCIRLIPGAEVRLDDTGGSSRR